MDKGMFMLEFQHNGKVVSVVIDDFLPCVAGEPWYTKSKIGSIWLSMLEKAYAKLLGGY